MSASRSMRNSAGLVLAFALFLLALPPAAQAQAPGSENPCDRLLRQDRGPIHPATIDELLDLFRSGFVPDFTKPDQRAIFELYRILRFGNPQAVVPVESYRAIVRALNRHRDLEKKPLRNFLLFTEERVHPVSPALKGFLDAQKTAMGKVQTRLFERGADAGLWKKLAVTGPVPAHPEELFFWLLDAANAGRNPRVARQAAVDLVHTSGYRDPAIKAELEHADGLVRLRAYRTILAKREEFLRAVGIKESFEGFMKSLGVIQPTGVHSTAELEKTLQALESELIENAVAPVIRQRMIRHLSLVESPFRGCLGDDCSTENYPLYGLDPSFHYFTITDETGHSSGQVTVVLGEGVLSSGRKPIAYVDKIQNVSREDLPLLIEGIRRSVAEDGYTLALPVDLGEGDNAISNREQIISWIRSDVPVRQDAWIRNFKPGRGVPELRVGDSYSRAFDQLPLREVLPMKEISGARLEPGPLQSAVSKREVAHEHLLGSLPRLKAGSIDERIQYVLVMSALERTGLLGNPESVRDFAATLKEWISDRSVDFRVRKQILLTSWQAEEMNLPGLLDHFSETEQVVLIQNLLDTPRFRVRLELESQILSDLMIRARDKPAVLRELIGEYFGTRWGMAHEGFFDEIIAVITAVLREPLQSKAQIFESVEHLRLAVWTNQLADLRAGLESFEGRAVEPAVLRFLSRFHLFRATSESELVQSLAILFESSDRTTRRLAAGIAEESESFTGFRASIPLQTYREILARAGWQELSRFHQELRLWMGRSDIDLERKAWFLASLMGTRRGSFARAFEALPKSERSRIWEPMARTSNLRLFERIATEQGLREPLFDETFFDSFQFVPAPQGAMQVQGAPVSQLQWLLIMGSNPSQIVAPWSPVETVMFHEITEFLRRLNEQDGHYRYRIPTDAEQKAIQAWEGGLPVRVNLFEKIWQDLGRGVSEWIQDPAHGRSVRKGPTLGFRLIREPK